MDGLYNEIESVGCRIRQFYKGKSITQETADGRSLAHPAKVEMGKPRCSLEMLIDIASFSTVSLNCLVWGKTQPAMVEGLNSAIVKMTAVKQIL